MSKAQAPDMQFGAHPVSVSFFLRCQMPGGLLTQVPTAKAQILSDPLRPPFSATADGVSIDNFYRD